MMRFLLPLIILAGCAATDRVGPVRFVNAPPTWRVNDRLHTPKPPEERPFLRAFYHVDSFYLRATRGLNLERSRRSIGINALDEVPDSTWFTNRIGRREVTPEEIFRGPGSGEAPDLHFPWTVDSGKEGGTAIGLRVVDARGVKFLLKFDQKHEPEVETGADVVVARLLWAAGYNVPEDHIVYFTRQDLKVTEKSYVKVRGKKQRLDDAFIDRQLEQIAIGADGRIRGLASVYIDGKPIGGGTRLGVRKDDPNDRIPHELRRDQRGQLPLFAWLSHTDIKEDNTFDTYVKDPGDPAVHYVLHYLIDFGNALGTQSKVRRRPYPDYQYDVDLGEWLSTIFTLGLHRQPWEGRIDPQIPGVGLYSAEHYDPGKWKANTFAQLHLLESDRIDNFWGSKLLMKFTRKQLEAAVAAGKYTDPRAANYLVDTMIRRQRITAHHWFRQVNPIDEISIVQDGTGGRQRLCFTDLSLHYGLVAARTQFTITAHDRDGRPLAPSATIEAGARGKACVDAVRLADKDDRYTIFRIDTSRGMPGTLVHVAVDPATQVPRVIGIYRL